MSLSPADTAALVATLAARADDRQFLLDSAATPLRALLHRYPAAQGLLPQPGEQPYLVAFAVLYRRIMFSGGLVVAQANIPTAEALLAQDAEFQMDLYDLRNPVTDYTPGGAGVQSGP